MQGINLDIVRDMCIRADVECTFKLLPWARAYKKALAEPFSGVVSTVRNEQREHRFKWVGPLVSSGSFFYRLASNEHINPSTIDDISQYSLGVARGSIYKDLVVDMGFQKDKNLLEFSYHYEYLNLFFKNKLDLIIGSELTLKHQLLQYGYSSDDVVKLLAFPNETMKGNYLAFNKDMPKELVERFRLALEELNKNQFNEYKARY